MHHERRGGNDWTKDSLINQQQRRRRRRHDDDNNNNNNNNGKKFKHGGVNCVCWGGKEGADGVARYQRGIQRLLVVHLPTE